MNKYTFSFKGRYIGNRSDSADYVKIVSADNITEAIMKILRDYEIEEYFTARKY